MVAPFSAQRGSYLYPSYRKTSLKLRLPEGHEPRRISFEHEPGPRSILLFKIVAMEAYEANAPRRERQRQFCERAGKLGALVN